MPLMRRTYSQALRIYLPERNAVTVGPHKVRDASDTEPKALRPVVTTVDETRVMLEMNVPRSSSS